jgi:hypothetical protein
MRALFIIWLSSGKVAALSQVDGGIFYSSFNKKRTTQETKPDTRYGSTPPHYFIVRKLLTNFNICLTLPLRPISHKDSWRYITALLTTHYTTYNGDTTNEEHNKIPLTGSLVQHGWFSPGGEFADCGQHQTGQKRRAGE